MTTNVLQKWREAQANGCRYNVLLARDDFLSVVSVCATLCTCTRICSCCYSMVTGCFGRPENTGMWSLYLDRCISDIAWSQGAFLKCEHPGWIHTPVLQNGMRSCWFDGAEYWISFDMIGWITGSCHPSIILMWVMWNALRENFGDAPLAGNSTVSHTDCNLLLNLPSHDLPSETSFVSPMVAVSMAIIFRILFTHFGAVKILFRVGASSFNLTWFKL